MKPIYLDVAASSQVNTKVLKKMIPYFTQEYGNPSSSHELGELAYKALTSSRVQLAKVIGARAHEILFTSGTSESDSWVFQGLARAYPQKKTIVISAIEHAAVRETCLFLKSQGYALIEIPVNREGILDRSFLERTLKNNKDILVVSVAHANNVIGTIQDISSIGKLCRKYSVFFHTDAAQSFSKIKIDVSSIDLLSASAHKIGGPKGIGLLYVREGVSFKPLIFGGGQERGLRGGTENVSGAVGFAEASSLWDYRSFENLKVRRDSFIKKLESIGGVLNGSKDHRLANNIHVSFSGVDGRMLVTYLSGKKIYVSSGSACESKQEKEDHVLSSIGLSKDLMNGSLRITFDDSLSVNDIDRVVLELKKGLKLFRVNR